MNAELLQHACDSRTGEGHKVDSERFDVSDSAAVEAVQRRNADRHGYVDVLVNNAGMVISDHPVERRPAS